jgi:competence protein ComEC
MNKAEKNLSLLIGLGLLLIAIILVVAPPSWPSAQSHRLTVTALDVGQGDSVFIRTPEGVTILIDSGPDNQVVQRLAAVMPWWQHKIDYLVLTHSHLDHYGGLQSVIEKYQVGEFWYSGDESNHTASYRSLFGSLHDRQIPVKTIRQGDEWQWDSGVRLHWLWPVAIPPGDPNAISLVGRLSWGSEDVLLVGDLPSAQEQLLLDSGQAVEAEVLKVGHHGSKYSSSPSFLAAVHPQLCLISAGKDNSFGHPHAETLKRLHDVNCQTDTTIEDGSMTVELTTSTWRWYRSADLPSSLFLGILKKVNII